MQGGGFYYDGTSLTDVPSFAAVKNEPGISNTRGTIAMAKVPPPSGGPDSATNEWFFNVSNNGGTSPNGLDFQNGGFTAFGRVINGGMSVVDAINALPDFDLDGSSSTLFDNVPLKNIPGTLAQNLIYVNSVTTLNYPKGDYNFDTKADINDYNVWKANLGSKTAAEADGNGNGIVDAADYTIWRDSLGQMIGPGSGAGAAVPEPASIVLLTLAVATLLSSRIRRGNSVLMAVSLQPASYL